MPDHPASSIWASTSFLRCQKIDMKPPRCFCVAAENPDHLRSSADETIYLNLRESQIKGLRLSASWRLFRLLRREQYDVVICHRYKPVSMMLFLNRFLRVPLCIGVSHGFGEYDRSYRKRQVRRSISPAWRFVGVSPAVKAHLIGLDVGLDEGNTEAITNAVDLRKIDSQHLSSPTRAKPLVYLGRAHNRCAGSPGAYQGASIPDRGVRLFVCRVS